MSGIPKGAIKRARELASLIERHRKLYHEKDEPEISDEAYDSLVQELLELKKKYIEIDAQYTETDVVGGRPDDAFKKVPHRVRQWSFDNVFSDIELKEWEERLLRVLEKQDLGKKKVTYVSEHKIDGLKIILEYTKGKLVRATTRGDGVTGEDITHSARVIKDIPHTLKSPSLLLQSEKRGFLVTSFSGSIRSEKRMKNRYLQIRGMPQQDRCDSLIQK